MAVQLLKLPETVWLGRLGPQGLASAGEGHGRSCGAAGPLGFAAHQPRNCPTTADSPGFTGPIGIWDRQRNPIVTCDFNGITWKKRCA